MGSEQREPPGEENFEYGGTSWLTYAVTWPLVLINSAIGLWVLGVALAALAGASGEYTILGAKDTFPAGAWSILGELTVGLAVLAVGVYLADFPWMSLRRRGCDDPAPAVAQPAIAWRTTTPQDSRVAGEEVLRLVPGAHTLAFTQRGELLATGGSGTHLWDLADGRRLLDQPDERYLVAISPDGEQLAVTRGSLGIVLRSLRDGDERTIVHRASVWKRGWGSVSAIAFSADGQRLASAGDPDTRIWSVADGRELLRIPTGATEFDGLRLAFSPNGAYVATGSPVHPTTIWDSHSGKRLQRLRTTPIALTFSPDSRLLATMDDDGSLSICDVATGDALWAAPADGRSDRFGMPSLAWTPDARMLIAPRADGTIRGWETAGARELVLAHHRSPGAPVAVAVSPDGSLLATSDATDTVRVWTLA